MTKKKVNIKKFSEDLIGFRKENKLSRQKMMNKMGGGSRQILLEIEMNHRLPSVEVAYGLCEIMGKDIGDYMR